jgi:hypothetical protein
VTLSSAGPLAPLTRRTDRHGPVPHARERRNPNVFIFIVQMIILRVQGGGGTLQRNAKEERAPSGGQARTTSSEMTSKLWRTARAAMASSSDRENILPVGLWGVLRRRTLVRGVILEAISAMSSFHACAVTPDLKGACRRSGTEVSFPPQLARFACEERGLSQVTRDEHFNVVSINVKVGFHRQDFVALVQKSLHTHKDA